MVAMVVVTFREAKLGMTLKVERRRVEDGERGRSLSSSRLAMVVDEIHSSSRACGKVNVGDELVGVDGRLVTAESLEAVTKRIGRRRPVELAFVARATKDRHKRRRHEATSLELSPRPVAPPRRKRDLSVGARCELTWRPEGYEMFRGDGNPIDEEEGDSSAARVKSAFVKGTYCRCRVVGYDDEDFYSLAYESGPHSSSKQKSTVESLFVDCDETSFGFSKVTRENVVLNYADLPFRPEYPWFLLSISALQIIMFVCFSAEKKHTKLEKGLWMRVVGSFPDCQDLRPEVWRFFSYAFVHAGARHVCLNVVLQMIFGLPLEIIHGAKHTALIYGLGVIAGGLVSAVVRPYDAVVGSSGGVYALMGCHLGNLALNWHSMERGSFLGRKTRLAFYALLLSVDVAQYSFAPHPNVSYATHSGGYLAGFALAFSLLIHLDAHQKGLTETKHHIKKYLRYFVAFSASSAAVGLVFVVAFNWPPTSLGKSCPCCETLLNCKGLRPSDYGLLSCSKKGYVNFRGFYDTHSQHQGATCQEIYDFVAASTQNILPFLPPIK